MNIAINIFKGVGISIIFTLALLLVLAIALTYTSVPEKAIEPAIIVISGVSVLIGSSIGNFKIKKSGIINGSLIGAIYFMATYLLSSLATMNFRLTKEMAILIFVGILFGILGGIVGVNKK